MTYEIQQYILKHGKHYTPARLPAGFKRGKVGDCFDSSILNAMMFPEYKYVEGLAAHPFEENVWILHAWLTDGERAFDPTWGVQYKNHEPLPVLTTYIGIEMDLRTVARFMKETEYKCVMANGWRNREIADLIIPNFPYKKDMQ